MHWQNAHCSLRNLLSSCWLMQQSILSPCPARPAHLLGCWDGCPTACQRQQFYWRSAVTEAPQSCRRAAHLLTAGRILSSAVEHRISGCPCTASTRPPAVSRCRAGQSQTTGASSSEALPLQHDCTNDAWPYALLMQPVFRLDHTTQGCMSASAGLITLKTQRACQHEEPSRVPAQTYPLYVWYNNAFVGR